MSNASGRTRKVILLVFIIVCDYKSNNFASQLINYIPSAIIDGTDPIYAISKPLPSVPFLNSLSQRGSNISASAQIGSSGAIFVIEDNLDEVEVQQSQNIQECKLHLVDDFSLCIINPPDSRTFINVFDPDIEV
ncbi:MAG: hypothetical protein EZS28_046536 [Streblomastix strix]|uniref:Uncharacterized protein n=1 Tax=Streblomastix strix TaxID=222440 RepID=A0A5J4TI66_9EUKA|nr:MAG: hypothetical protein EZS28_046536 [Streblomastix strix]